jgi:hypothetical protein
MGVHKFLRALIEVIYCQSVMLSENQNQNK